MRRNPFLLILCVAHIAGSGPAGAQGEPGALSLDEVVASALRSNPDLRIARLRTDSSHAELKIARSYTNPDLAVAPNNPYQYSIAAPLDVGPQRTYRTRAANDGVRATALDARDTERLIIFAVRADFFDLLLADTLAAIARDQRGILRDLLAADSASVRAGSVPERNLAKSELELAKSDAAVTRADNAVRAVRLTLQAAMGIPHPDTAFRVRGSLGVGAPAVAAFPAIDLDSAIGARPDVQAAEARTRASGDSRRFAEALLVPVPGLVLVQQRESPFPNGGHYALGVTAQLPVWNWFSGERERATASVEQSRVAEERTRVQAVAEITGALDELRAASALAAKFGADLLDKARTSYQTSRYAYSAGAISYVELLDAVRTYGEVRADAAEAGHDYWVALYAVERALGRTNVPR